MIYLPSFSRQPSNAPSTAAWFGRHVLKTAMSLCLKGTAPATPAFGSPSSSTSHYETEPEVTKLAIKTPSRNPHIQTPSPAEQSSEMCSPTPLEPAVQVEQDLEALLGYPTQGHHLQQSNLRTGDISWRTTRVWLAPSLLPWHS